jgi:hypothetical protein
MKVVAMRTVQLKLREASIVLGVSPKDLQNLVQFGVLQPQRKDRFFIFDRALLLEAKVAFYLKESLGTSVPLLARFTREIFKDTERAKPGSVANVFLLSRPTRGKEVVRIEIPLQALDKELEAQLPNTESRGKDARGRKSENWKAQITSTFEEAADDLKDTTERDILDEIKRYRAQRKKSPEISVIALPQEKTA